MCFSTYWGSGESGGRCALSREIDGSRGVVTATVKTPAWDCRMVRIWCGSDDIVMGFVVRLSAQPVAQAVVLQLHARPTHPGLF